MARNHLSWIDRLEARHNAEETRSATLRRIAEDRYFDRLEREAELREKKCPALIGHLCSGRVYVIGRNGKERYFATVTEAEDFLIRNGYVS